MSTDPRSAAAPPPHHRDTRLRFEQWAHNPACDANTISAVHGVAMALVAKREGATPTMGQSPFAIARGQTFEQSLFRRDAAILRDALVQAGVLPPLASGFQDFRLRQQRGPFRTLDAAMDATAEFLRSVARTPAHQMSTLPSIAAGAVVRVPGKMMLPEAILVVDAVVLQVVNGHPELMIGEIKTYPDRGGYTDSGELATARAQAGVYVHGMRLVLGDLGLADSISVRDEGFLVLTRPGSNRPSVRAGESLRYQAERAARGFERLRAVASLPGIAIEPAAIVDAVLSAATSYDDACLGFCDRAAKCHAAALAAGDPVALGHDVARFLGKTTLHRVVELLEGADPSNVSETDLVRRLREYGRGSPK